MAKYIDAKCKLCRREGTKLYLKGARCYSPKCPLERKGATVPGEHGQKRRSKLSDYGFQLREKQKLKRYYGVLERPFRRYYQIARKAKQDTGEKLLQILESRLDNLVYRAGFAPSRSVARQLVSHGHILVDAKKVNIPSYLVKPGQVVSLSPQAQKINLVAETLADKDINVPSWLKRKAVLAKLERLPKRDEIDVDVQEQLIVEFYSR
jgi:small subunit ribosomal protein S4